MRVVEIATAQDVGKAINPQAVEGQIEGGIAQGLGLALMEEIQVVDGEVRNASFTDYLIPTVLDMPPVKLDVLELGDPEAPYGLRGDRRAADDLLDPGDRERAARRDRRRADARARAPRRHRRALMPAAPAELTAHFTIEGPDDATRCWRRCATSGLARDAGPGELVLAGPRDAVLDRARRRAGGRARRRRARARRPAARRPRSRAGETAVPRRAG